MGSSSLFKLILEGLKGSDAVAPCGPRMGPSVVGPYKRLFDEDTMLFEERINLVHDVIGIIHTTNV